VKYVARLLLSLVFIAVACVGAWRLWNYYMLSAWTRDARVQADVVAVAPDVAGFVNDLRVSDNQFVHKGDVLFVLDQARYALALATATANVAARKADMNSRLHIAERRAKLNTLAVSEEEKETARFTSDAATGAYEQALADQAVARLNLDRTVVRAPVNGFVTTLTVVVGQYVSIGTKLLALIDSDSYRITAYFEETKIPGIRIGDSVAIHFMDNSPALRGHVDSISHGITDQDNGNGPELLANVTPTFEWVRLAQRIPVHIQIDEVPAGVFISSGMTCTVIAGSSLNRPSVIEELVSDAQAYFRHKDPL
jgi:multidrug resistance efflux pump